MGTTETKIDREVINLTIDALNNSQAGLDKFRNIFTTCSNHFDSGEDEKGLSILKDALPQLKEFAEFCASVMDICNAYLPEEEANEFVKKCDAFRSQMIILVTESEKNDFVEVSDVLRFDFCDLFQSFLNLFPKLATQLENSLK